MNESEEKENLKASIRTFIAGVTHNVVKSDSVFSTDGETSPINHLLDLLRKSLLGRIPMATTENGKPQQYTFRNVQELKAAGIHVKHDSKKGDLLRNIDFKKWYFFAARLYLPRITVDDSTGPKFLNLIAYEMCPDFENDFGVTSYISFLDSLIDYPSDVTELRKASILHNHLGSDEEVAQLFNEIGTDLVPDPAAYEQVKKEIQKFYKTKWKTWIAEVFHDHFSSPWTITAFLAALLGLGLTGLQTWYSVKPS